ncbi:5-oxoprolinase subunit PxpA [Sinomicrobium soli]|uniref:5-oxoprolinase subunit PxpA n=1 Tax=Sinomicrobium sp. N-1-3-6 TaxID=2219864 RepID=UPI000DCE74BE|nr:5-oxoprolinase subunit PxpA [Sinomicrobium sp. N-1-3-6]RAV29293.1 lactam utilization protein LamB [Sinomicrobium sp. N-1-3-6]
MPDIKINCDLGEGLDNEALLMPYISSCSIACGGHAGSRDIMERVVELALEHRVHTGAHPSYPDRENFGRRSVEMEDGALIRSIREQLLFLSDILEEKGAALHHIKAHGALYNDMAEDTQKAAVFLEAIAPFTEQAVLYAPFGSEVAKMAEEKGTGVVYEAFADRNYTDRLTLVPRTRKDAVITDKEKIREHVVRMLEEHRVRTAAGRYIPIKADTFCLHGDNSNAVEILEYLALTS